jgi:predicted glycogen debranching enzyme
MNEPLMVGRDAAEWLVTNGLGGYASSTVSGLNTRRYHGLLVAALRPPVLRTALVSKMEASVRYGDIAVALGTNEYADGTIDPSGYRYLESFRLEGSIPLWTWTIGDARLEQRLWMAHSKNTTYIDYQMIQGSLPLEIELQPLCTYRDFHWQHRGKVDYSVRALADGFEMTAYSGATPYRILLESGRYALAPDWYWNFKHREESARGLDDIEDLYRPAVITLSLEAGKSVAVVLSAEVDAPMASAQSLRDERGRQARVLELARVGRAADYPPWIDHLVLAADQFIVERRDAAGSTLGQTLIAGYPWFSDWGRDTMIALPGLTIATGRADIAASILRVFAKFVSEGLLPNRFPDAGEAPEYNTVDATLWYFIAIDEYSRRTGDTALRRELYPVLKEIIDWHVRGTKFGIHVDPEDGLLSAGAPGVQLTWMDAKVGDWVVTPRSGKCVEINALWFNALMIMREFAAGLGDTEAARGYAAQSARVASSFNQRFWFEAGGYLYDVVDSPDVDGSDASLRPNQMFAVSLRHSLLNAERARAVVDICARELWTPVGLRSLASSDPRFMPQCVGGVRDRDSAYHQGTVWSWLLGSFALAHYRVYRDKAAARGYLSGIEAHLREACIGQVSEIFDGAAPFSPRGCIAQAWGVGETLRAWSELNVR